MSDSENSPSSDEDRDQILVKMHEVTNLGIDVCNSLLDEAEWDLQVTCEDSFLFNTFIQLAILNHFRRPVEKPQINITETDDSPQPSSQVQTSPLSSAYFVPQYLCNQFMLLTRLVAAWYQRSLHTTTMFSPTRLVFNLIHFCVESSRIIGRLLWSLAFTEEPVPIQGTFIEDELVPYGDPESDVIKFVAEFNEMFGHQIPSFYHAPLRKARQMCAQNTKYLLMYIHDNNSMECEQFSRNVLCNAEVISFIDDNFIIWACGCTSYESVEVLRAEHCRRCPFIAVYAPQAGQMTLCGRISSCNTPEAFMDRLSEIMSDTEPLIAQEIERRNRLLESQQLREEQDASYLRSLQADQEKARRKEEEIKQRDAEAKLLQLEIQEIKLLQMNALDELAMQTEPSPLSADAIILSFRLPKGTCLRRRFLTSDCVKVLYIYMRSHAAVPVNFHLYTSFPKTLILEVRKQILSCADDACLASVGLCVSQSLLVQDLDT